MDELIGLFTAAAGRMNLTEEKAAHVAYSWFDAPYWVNLMITCMGRREFRDATGQLTLLGEAGRAIAATVPRAHWLDGLSAVLDDEPVVVIDHATGRGYRLSMSGVGDNFQLHTLLADQLIGDPGQGMVPGQRPAPEWVAAANTGPAETRAGTRRLFRLYDGAGAYIYPEGKPADIAQIDGARVIVLHPPRGEYRWRYGRTYLDMIPAMTLDAIMTADEAAAWRQRITPARQTDLYARNPI